MKLGLTGGIGCGKSEALRIFGEAGWRTLSTDSIARDLLDRNQGVRSAVMEEFGTLERKEIAVQAFREKGKKAVLEGILHPRINRHWRDALEKAPEDNWVVEIPLLVEKRLETHFDLVVCVNSSPGIQLQRLVQRGMAREDALARMANQAPLPEKIEKSDIVLTNNGSISFLEAQIRKLCQGFGIPPLPR
jgi:dephospho-CoA kinase